MAIYDQAQPIDIQNIQISNRKLSIAIDSMSSQLSEEDLASIDTEAIQRLLDEEGVKTLTIRPAETNSSEFICRMNHKKIMLITKNSIKKTKFELDIPTLTLVVNERKADISVLKGFIQKIETIGQLVKDQKAIAYGNE